METQIRFNFLHAADLHLDSPVQILSMSESSVLSKLSMATLDSLTDLCTCAIDEKVDFIVLAGDVYDGIRRGIRAQLRLFNEMSRLKDYGINVYMVHGNHDPIVGSKDISIKWPSNLFIFPTIPTTFSLEKEGETYCRITGVSYRSKHEDRNLALQFPNVRNSSFFEIAVLHTNIGSATEHGNYAPATLDDLLTKGYDYWALGHIHKRAVLSENPVVIYPGNLQGLHMKPSERGPKGAELVEVKGGTISHWAKAIAKVIFDQIDFDVSRYETFESILHDLVQTIKSLSEGIFSTPLVVRIQFIGVAVVDIEEAFRDLEGLSQVVTDEVIHSIPNVLVESVASQVTPSRTLEDMVGLSDIITELIEEIERWQSSDMEIGTDGMKDSSRRKVLQGLARLGLDDVLHYDQNDLLAAKGLLALLFSEEREN